jgi:hypothetical protein
LNADRSVADDRLRAFLAETLDLWQVKAAVESGAPRSSAVIRTENGTVVWIERPGDPSVPFRWQVRWRRAGDPPGGREHHPKACASIVGVLGALRTVFGMERGQALRIAAAAAVN